MVITARAAEILADARDMHAAALERLAADDIRDASDKAWCATKRACDASSCPAPGKNRRRRPRPPGNAKAVG